jgi:ketosteroid isomerase-like protein
VPTLEETTRGNADLIDRLFTLSNRSAIGDATALSELVSSYHDDAELTSALGLVPGDLREDEPRAQELIRRYFERVTHSCYLWFIYADEVQEYGDDVLALGGIRTVDKETRDDRERPVGWVFEIRDGRVKSAQAFPSHADALAAVRRRDQP